MSGSTSRDAAWPASSLLGRLSERNQRELLAIGTAVRYPPHRAVINQGKHDTYALLLLSGLAKVTFSDEAGSTTLLAIRVGGDLVGEMAALDGRARSATVATCTEVLAKRISKPDLTDFLTRNPDGAVELAGMVSQRLRWANRRRSDFFSCAAPVRVARIILELTEAYGRPARDGWELGVPMTRSELASIGGMAVRTAEKAIQELQQAGIVDTGYRQLFVPDLEILRSRAEIPQ